MFQLKEVVRNLPRNFLLLATVASVWPACAQSETASTPPADSPPNAVLSGLNADPHIAFFGDRCYIYPTTDGTKDWRSTSFQAWSSEDLVDWKNEGVIFDLPRDLKWADIHAWAPAIATKNGKYYFYFSANRNIGVAVADSPVGPFQDPLGKPLVSAQDYPGMQCIDPMVFVDDDGSAYLYWGQRRSKVVRLNDDMTSFDPADVRDITPPGYNEGPFVHKRNGTYYLSWSEFDTRDPRYSVAYGTSDSPLGPFIKAADNPILKQEENVRAAGHHSIGKLPGRDEWVVAYHRFQVPDGDGYHRETCISPLRHNEDGSIQPVDVYESVEPTDLVAAPADPAGYLFVTFRGEGSPEGEQVYFALSNDGKMWKALNDSKPVLVSTVGEKGVRDPYLLRRHDGDGFYLIATDLSIHRNGDWNRAVRGGSHSIVIWESPDLIDWSGPRLVEVAPKDSGCTWAPEAIYDDANENYLVFWASTTARDDYAKHRIWAARTEDFRTFSEPFIYIEKPTTVIDTTIVQEGGSYFRFTKDEKYKAISLEASTRLAGPWREVPEFSLFRLRGYEGPQCYKLEAASDGPTATWCLLLDQYSRGEGYQPYITHDLPGGEFEPAEDFEFPFKFRHGSVLALRSDEYRKLQASMDSGRLDDNEAVSTLQNAK